MFLEQVDAAGLKAFEARESNRKQASGRKMVATRSKTLAASLLARWAKYPDNT